MPLPTFDVRPILELRARFERRAQGDLSDVASDDASNFLGRARAGFGFTAGPVRGQLVYQYAYGETVNFNRHISTTRSDLVLGFAQGRLGEVEVTAGRQRLEFGSARLLGVGDWNNISNAWDGGRADLRGGTLFAVRSGLRATPDETLSLYGGAYALGPVQGLLVHKHDGRGRVEETTVSAQFRHRIGRVGLDAEAAGQVGRRAGRDVLAGAVDAIGTLPLAPRFSLSVQGSLASGGGPGGTSHTFDQLYPSAHDRHGLLDLAGWQNLRDLGAWIRYEPDRRTGVKLQYHHLELQSKRDAWYGAGGAPNRGPAGAFVDPTGGSGRDLGDEIDLDATHTVDARGTARAGIGLFRPGSFVRAFNGDATRDQVFGYVQYTYRF